MATITTGFKIWDSTYFMSCDCSGSGSGSGDAGNIVQCWDGDGNPRGAQLQPKVNCDTGLITWFLADYLASYPTTIVGARNGVAVTNPFTGEVTVWDVAGTTVAAKLLAFADICNCVDCTGNLTILAGEYECIYPAVPTNTYCYNVTITGSDGANNSLRLFAMNINNYLNSYPIQTAYNPATSVAVYRVCLSAPIASIGKPATQTWVLV